MLILSFIHLPSPPPPPLPSPPLPSPPLPCPPLPWQSEVWVFMELMATCLDRLLKKVGPFPEIITCKMTVSVSITAHMIEMTL